MAQNDVYEVTLTQRFRGQTMNNVFQLRQELAYTPTGTTVAFDLATRFAATFVPLLTTWQSIDVVTTAVRARNLFDVSDDYTLSLAVPGSAPATASTMPTFTAVGFLLDGDNAAVKNGAKRFAGIGEESVEDGVITNGTLLIQLADLAEAMTSFITGGAGLAELIWKFVIVKRIRSGVAGAYEYRMPENVGETVFSRVINAALKVLLTSQVSRKIGVGV